MVLWLRRLRWWRLIHSIHWRRSVYTGQPLGGYHRIFYVRNVGYCGSKIFIVSSPGRRTWSCTWSMCRTILHMVEGKPKDGPKKTGKGDCPPGKWYKMPGGGGDKKGQATWTALRITAEKR